MRIITYSSLAAIVFCGTLNAQRMADGHYASNAIHSDSRSTGTWVRTDVVDEHFAIQPWHANALRRDVYRLDDGTWFVRVISATGTLRHTGTYLDAALTVPHGEFVYYHPSGQLESSGRYQQGIKAGIWERGSWDGRRLAERVYTGLAWDDLEIFAGVATRAASLQDHRK